jgi:1-aminocyclopropane-1-carboxylate synthase
MRSEIDLVEFPGFCYSEESLLAYCRFAERHNLHLIVDEI